VEVDKCKAGQQLPRGQQEAMIFPCNTICFLMDELSDAVRNMDPMLNWKWENLGIWHEENFHAVVQHLHDAEEHIYLPWIETKVKIPESSNWRLRRSTLIQAIKEISELIKAGRQASPSQKSRMQMHLCQVVENMVENMHKHFAQEEEVMPCLLREAGFSLADQEAVMVKIIESWSLSGKSVVVPTMVHALERSAGPEKATAFVQSLPYGIRFLHSYFWDPDFKARQQGLIHSVRRDEVKNPTASFFASFTAQESKKRLRLDTKRRHKVIIPKMS